MNIPSFRQLKKIWAPSQAVLVVPEGLNTTARVVRKLNKKEQKHRAIIKERIAQAVVCEKCKQHGGTLRRLPFKKGDEKLYIHQVCP